MNRWEGLDEFVAVAECSGFMRAAERLRVSSSRNQPTGSARRTPAARLLYRTTRRVSCRGRAYLLHPLPALIEERDEAFLAISDLHSARPGCYA